MFFWNSLAFLMIQRMLEILLLVPLPFLNPAWKFTVHALLKPDLENFEQYFASVWVECNCGVVWISFGIVFLWDWNENWPFPVLVVNRVIRYFSCGLLPCYLTLSPQLPSLTVFAFIRGDNGQCLHKCKWKSVSVNDMRRKWLSK